MAAAVAVTMTRMSAKGAGSWTPAAIVMQAVEGRRNQVLTVPAPAPALAQDLALAAPGNLGPDLGQGQAQQAQGSQDHDPGLAAARAMRAKRTRRRRSLAQRLALHGLVEEVVLRAKGRATKKPAQKRKGLKVRTVSDGNVKNRRKENRIEGGDFIDVLI